MIVVLSRHRRVELHVPTAPGVASAALLVPVGAHDWQVLEWGLAVLDDQAVQQLALALDEPDGAS